MSLIEEAREWLEKMKAHTDCCGVPMVRKLVQALDDANARVEQLEGAMIDALPENQS